MRSSSGSWDRPGAYNSLRPSPSVPNPDLDDALVQRLVDANDVGDVLRQIQDQHATFIRTVVDRRVAPSPSVQRPSGPQLLMSPVFAEAPPTMAEHRQGNLSVMSPSMDDDDGGGDDGYGGGALGGSSQQYSTMLSKPDAQGRRHVLDVSTGGGGGGGGEPSRRLAGLSEPPGTPTPSSVHEPEDFDASAFMQQGASKENVFRQQQPQQKHLAIHRQRLLGPQDDAAATAPRKNPTATKNLKQLLRTPEKSPPRRASPTTSPTAALKNISMRNNQRQQQLKRNYDQLVKTSLTPPPTVTARHGHVNVTTFSIDGLVAPVDHRHAAGGPGGAGGVKPEDDPFVPRAPFGYSQPSVLLPPPGHLKGSDLSDGVGEALSNDDDDIATEDADATDDQGDSALLAIRGGSDGPLVVERQQHLRSATHPKGMKLRGTHYAASPTGGAAVLEAAAEGLPGGVVTSSVGDYFEATSMVTLQLSPQQKAAVETTPRQAALPVPGGGVAAPAAAGHTSASANPKSVKQQNQQGGSPTAASAAAAAPTAAAAKQPSPAEGGGAASKAKGSPASGSHRKRDADKSPRQQQNQHTHSHGRADKLKGSFSKTPQQQQQQQPPVGGLKSNALAPLQEPAAALAASQRSRESKALLSASVNAPPSIDSAKPSQQPAPPSSAATPAVVPQPAAVATADAASPTRSEEDLHGHAANGSGGSGNDDDGSYTSGSYSSYSYSSYSDCTGSDMSEDDVEGFQPKQQQQQRPPRGPPQQQQRQQQVIAKAASWTGIGGTRERGGGGGDAKPAASRIAAAPQPPMAYQQPRPLAMMSSGRVASSSGLSASARGAGPAPYYGQPQAQQLQQQQHQMAASARAAPLARAASSMHSGSPTKAQLQQPGAAMRRVGSAVPPSQLHLYKTSAGPLAARQPQLLLQQVRSMSVAGAAAAGSRVPPPTDRPASRSSSLHGTSEFRVPAAAVAAPAAGGGGAAMPSAAVDGSSRLPQQQQQQQQQPRMVMVHPYAPYAIPVEECQRQQQQLLAQQLAQQQQRRSASQQSTSQQRSASSPRFVAPVLEKGEAKGSSAASASPAAPPPQYTWQSSDHGYVAPVAVLASRRFEPPAELPPLQGQPQQRAPSHGLAAAAESPSASDVASSRFAVAR